MQLRGLKPDKWIELQQGLYTPNGKDTDNQAIMEQSAAATPDLILTNLASNLKGQGLTLDTTKPVETRSANGLTWKIYRAGNSMTVIDVGLTLANNQRTYIVLMQTLGNEHDAYYKSLFLPVLDALQATQ
jgi:hypothetical protein